MNNMSQIVTYLVFGFIAFKIWGFVASMRYENEPNGVVMYSLVIGWIIIQLYNSLPFKPSNKLIGYLILLLVVIVLSFAAGKLYLSDFVSGLLKRLHIPYTINRYIWYDLEGKEDTFVTIKFYDQKIAYYGRLGIYEEYQRFPQITLVDYQVWELTDVYGNEIMRKDYYNSGQRIMLDTSKADAIEFVSEVQGLPYNQNGRNTSPQ